MRRDDPGEAWLPSSSLVIVVPDGNVRRFSPGYQPLKRKVECMGSV